MHYPYIVVIIILSALIGSFLNVVIHRLPIMIRREWQKDCIEFLNCTCQPPDLNKTYNLFLPASHCPHCEKSIAPWDNIPLLSYLWLGGKCRNCKGKISARYPLVEFTTVLLSLIITLHFGLSIQTFFALLVTWILIAITLIDCDHQIIPDTLVIPLLWSGLIANLFTTFTTIESAIYGAIAGYLSLWSFTHLFALVTGKFGMGHGDFKLFAAFGALLGWQVLPFIILLASLAGSIIGLSLIVFKKHDRNIPIPFGPYLALAGWIAMVWGNSLINYYLTLLKL